MTDVSKHIFIASNDAALRKSPINLRSATARVNKDLWGQGYGIFNLGDLV